MAKCAWCTPTEELGEGTHGICPMCEARFDRERQERKEKKRIESNRLLHSGIAGTGVSDILPLSLLH